MQKIYVLLQHDKQTGPYSLEELIRFDLKPYDLIWVEGAGGGWYYPQEISALQPYLKFLQKPVAQVALRSMAATPAPPLPAAAPDPAPPLLSRSPEAEAKQLEQSVYAQFRQAAETTGPSSATLTQPAGPKRKRYGMAATGMVALLVGSAVAGFWLLHRSNGNMPAAPVAERVPEQNELAHTAIINGHPASKTAVTTAKKQEHPLSRHRAATGIQKPLAPKNVRPPLAHAPAADSRPQEAVAAPTNEPPAGNSTESSEAAAPAPQEKRKTLRDKILDIFRKKPADASGSETTPSANGERRSTRREADAGLTQQISIRLEVPNNWMLGIRSAKATLVNHSRETIDRAAVDILYFNDDNELLQTKTLHFNGIGAKGEKTVSIPDHPAATRLEYKVVSAEGKAGA